MEQRNQRTPQDLQRQGIDRALAGLEDAVRRCRNEDMRHAAVYAALTFLEMRAVAGAEADDCNKCGYTRVIGNTCHMISTPVYCKPKKCHASLQIRQSGFAVRVSAF